MISEWRKRITDFKIWGEGGTRKVENLSLWNHIIKWAQATNRNFFEGGGVMGFK